MSNPYDPSNQPQGLDPVSGGLTPEGSGISTPGYSGYSAATADVGQGVQPYAAPYGDQVAQVYPSYDQYGSASSAQHAGGAAYAAQPTYFTGYQESGQQQAYQSGYPQGGYAQAGQQQGYQQPYQAGYSQAGYAQAGQQQAYAAGGYTQPGAYPVAPKSKVAAGILAIIFGALGVHNFYLGNTSRAGLQLGLTLLGMVLMIVGVGVLIIMGIQVWAFIEGILILCAAPGSLPWGVDSRGVPLTS